ncbi:hypothetical protein [Succinimonas sp.]|uniref:hypothetical protein n=1 Tax=Succinimonas sp. TaxID=1936151 RepID=UPI00386E8D80
MSISLDALNNLENNSSYYLSDKGEVKKAGFIQRFKCFFNIGDSRKRVANLLSEIKKSLIASAENAETVALNRDLSSQSTKYVTGSDIKELVERFKVLNDTEIAKTSAKNILSDMVNKVTNSETSPLNFQENDPKLPVESSVLRDFLMEGNYNYLKNLPIKQRETTVINEDGNPENKKYQTLDTEKVEEYFKKDLELRTSLLKDIVKSKKLNNLSPRYLSYINDTLFNKNGTRNEFPVKDLKNPDEVLKDLFYKRLSKSKNDPDIQKNIDFIIKECQKDPDLQDIVENDSCYYRLADKGRLKSDEKTSSNIENLKACLKKAKELSDGNKKIFNQYKKLLIEKGLKIKPDLLTSIANQSKTMPLDKLRALNGKSSVKEIHDAMKQIHDNIETICASEDISKYASSGNDKTLFAELINSIFLAKLHILEKANLMEAFSSVNASKAQLAYKHFTELIDHRYNLSYHSYSPLPGNTEKLPIFLACDKTKHICQTMSQMADLLGEQLDITVPAIGQYFTTQGYEEYDVKELIKEIGKNSFEKTKNMVNDYIDKHISGSNTKFIRDIMYQRIMGLSDDTDQGFAFDINCSYSVLVKPAVRASMQWNICAALKKCSADPKTTYFARDLTVGRFEIALSDGKKLSNDFEKACNELAQYVTKNEAATYNSLSKEDKLKVNLIISVCSQETCTSLATESQRSMSPNGSVIYSPSYSGDPVVNKFNVSIGEDGSLSVSYEGKRHVATLEKKDSGEFFPLDAEQSYLGSSLNLKFEPDEIKRLSELDFSKYDDKKVMEEYLASDDANKIKKITETIPKDFRVSFDLSTDMELKTVSQAE